MLLTAGVLLALVTTALTTAGAAAADGAEPWANPSVAAELALPPALLPNHPAAASDAPRFQQVSAGLGYTCGILTDGAVVCWGRNYSDQATPPSGTFRQVSAGWHHTCGVQTDGAVACWGSNGSGRATPPSGTFKQVSVGVYHTCGVQTDGTVVCWGSGPTPPSGTFRQVSAGVCGVRTGGAVVCWGSIHRDAPTPLSGTFKQVSTRYGNTCGVRTDGAVACWRSYSGQATPPSGTFQQVSAGEGHTCGVRTDGTVACWGSSGSGQATPPSGTFQQVSAGEGHTCGVRTDDAVVCWGDDSSGEATPPVIVVGDSVAPTNVVATTDGVATVSVSWTAGRDAVSHEVFLLYGQDSPVSRHPLREIPNGSSHIFRDVLPGDYAVLVVAYDVDGNQQYTTSNQVTVQSSVPSPTGDYDANDDGLIEVSNLAQLDAIRYDPDGDGDVGTFQDYVASYTEAFPDAADGMGCPSSGCAGYELTADLDFDTNGNGRADAGDAYWNDGTGWFPISYLSSSFDGNGRTISNLYLDRDRGYAGLFGNIDEDGAVKRLGLIAVDITAGGGGGLAGESRGTIADCYVTGSVTNSGGHTGGLVGSSLGSITGSYADVDVTGNGEWGEDADFPLLFSTGGLVGMNSGTINGSYATGNVSSNVTGSKAVPEVGGLVGMNIFGTISGSYATGKVTSNGTGNDDAGSVGGLVGGNGGTITASYATGDVNSNSSAQAGGLAGSSPARTSIINSYAIGRISGQEDLVGGLVGGLVGRHNSDIFTASYWDTQTSGLTRSAGGVGKTTDEMQSPTNDNLGIYATWDKAVWDFGDQDDYPILRNVGPGILAPPEDFTAPTNVVAEVDCDDVTVTWTDGRGATSHEAVLFKSDYTGSPVSAPATDGSHVFSSVAAGSYVVAVLAYDAKGESLHTLSNEVTVPGTCAEDFTAPTNVVAKADCDDVTVTWTDGQGAASHEAVLFKSDFTGSPVSAPATNGSHVFSSVAAGSYVVAVLAYDAKGESLHTLSNEVTVPGTCAEDFTAPTNVVAKADCDDVTVTWTYGQGAASHLAVLFKSDFTGSPRVETATGGSHVFSEVAAGIYTAAVFALDAKGELLHSLSNEVTVPDACDACSSADQKAALVAFYDATDGPDWTRQTHWNSDKPIGDWHGVIANDAGCVTGLYLRHSGLSGAIPADIAQLKHLETLDLQNNELTGTIPAALGDLENLERLRLNQNLLEGEVPSELGNLNNLETLDLGQNRLEGEIPWQSLAGLKNLQWLYLNDQSYFRGQFINSPQFINDDANYLHGSLPANVGSYPPNLAWLDLSNNRLSGEIPQAMERLDGLGGIYLSGNQFTGCVPIPLFQVSTNDLADLGLEPCYDADSDRRALIAFHVAMNGDNWTNKWDMGKTMSSWHGVSLDENGRVIRLSLNSNELSNLHISFDGSIRYNEGMANLGRLSELQILVLQNNHLGGTIPGELGNLDNLEIVNLSSNNFTGTIPGELGNLSKLKYLGLHNNNLSGAIPSTLARLGALEYLYVSGDENRFDSEACIPAGLYDVPDHDLDQISGVSSCAINAADRKALEAIYDATGGEKWSNQLGWKTGQPIEEWHGVTVATKNITSSPSRDCEGRVTELKLSNNNLSGNIPAELGNLACLYHLDLSGNNLSGNIPNELGNLKVLQGRYSESYGLTKCPVSYYDHSSLDYSNLDNNVLDLSENDLTGEIPASLGNLRCLSKLDLSDNKTRHYIRWAVPPWHYVNGLEGQIPEETGKLVRTYLSEPLWQ